MKIELKGTYIYKYSGDIVMVVGIINEGLFRRHYKCIDENHNIFIVKKRDLYRCDRNLTLIIREMPEFPRVSKKELELFTKIYQNADKYNLDSIEKNILAELISDLNYWSTIKDMSI